MASMACPVTDEQSPRRYRGSPEDERDQHAERTETAEDSRADKKDRHAEDDDEEEGKLSSESAAELVAELDAELSSDSSVSSKSVFEFDAHLSNSCAAFIKSLTDTPAEISTASSSLPYALGIGEVNADSQASVLEQQLCDLRESDCSSADILSFEDYCSDGERELNSDCNGFRGSSMFMGNEDTQSVAGFEALPESTETVERTIEESREDVSTWIDGLAIPVTQRDGPENVAEESVCLICLDCRKDFGELKILPCDPRHVFHSSCITSWLSSNLSCPIDRKKFQKILNNIKVLF